MESRYLDVVGREPGIGTLITACNVPLSRRRGEASPPVQTALSRVTAAHMLGTSRWVVQRQSGQARSW